MCHEVIERVDPYNTGEKIIIYLASPYAHTDKKVRQQRADTVKKKTAELLIAGHIVFSPIAHGKAIKDYLPPHLEVDHRFWLRQDAHYLFAMTELYVLKLEGWNKSKGVAWEIATAKTLGVPCSSKRNRTSSNGVAWCYAGTMHP